MYKWRGMCVSREGMKQRTEGGIWVREKKVTGAKKGT